MEFAPRLAERWRFTGARLFGRLCRLDQKNNPLVFVTGEAGSGKSVLAKMGFFFGHHRRSPAFARFRTESLRRHSYQ